jgi:hypothetical protein
MKIRILGHPGNPAHADAKKTKNGEHSGVQTSAGDKFHGAVVDLPKDEAGLLIAAGRAKVFEVEEKAEKAEKEEKAEKK